MSARAATLASDGRLRSAAPARSRGRLGGVRGERRSRPTRRREQELDRSETRVETDRPFQEGHLRGLLSELLSDVAFSRVADRAMSILPVSRPGRCPPYRAHPGIRLRLNRVLNRDCRASLDDVDFSNAIDQSVSIIASLAGCASISFSDTRGGRGWRCERPLLRCRGQGVPREPTGGRRSMTILRTRIRATAKECTRWTPQCA